MQKLNDRIQSLFAKSDCATREKTIILNCIMVDYNGALCKKAFVNSELEQLFDYYTITIGGKDYPNGYSFICDINGELLAESQGVGLHCISDYNENAYSLKMMMAKTAIQLELNTIYGIVNTKIHFSKSQDGQWYTIDTRCDS